ncbi:MAG: hypothetical protein MJ252_00930 [archaeon]|nr:hypothetical protein [archaeon]
MINKKDSSAVYKRQPLTYTKKDFINNDLFQTTPYKDQSFFPQLSPNKNNAIFQLSANDKKKGLKAHPFNAPATDLKRKASKEENNIKLCNKDTVKSFLLSKKEERIYSIGGNEKKNQTQKEVSPVKNEKETKEVNEKNNELFLQINELIANKKKKSSGQKEKENKPFSLRYSSYVEEDNSENDLIKSDPIGKFKMGFNRNPFKSTEITSIQNKKFPKEDLINKKKEDELIILPHEFKKNSSSVIEYSYNENMNKVNRSTMQDLHKIVDNFMSSPTRSLFVLFDGHGTSIKNSLKYGANNYPLILSSLLNENNFDIQKSIKDSFNSLDNELKDKFPNELKDSGSTLTVIYIDTNKENKKLFVCANVGDSMAILIKKDKSYEILSEAHKCSNKEEQERILSKGGLVFNQRLFGQLALSRAIGDFSFKQNGLENNPHYIESIINEEDIFIVVASDGVWDVLKYEDISQICFNEENTDSDIIGKKIVQSAIDNGSADNISCIVIRLN